ncbi:hypothetical protein LguiB_006671 [Lonicera macranthoides]
MLLLSIIAIVCLLSLLGLLMAKTKVPSKQSKKKTHSPPNPPPSFPPVKKSKHDASGSKGKGIQAEPSHPSSGQPVMAEAHYQPETYFPCFASDAQAKEFTTQYSKAKVNCERNVNLMAFKPSTKRNTIVPSLVYDWLMVRHWDKVVQNHSCYPFIVREFYFLANLVEHPKGHRLVARIRGVDTYIDADSIRQIYSLPLVENPQYPYSVTQAPNINSVLSELMGSPHTWDNLLRVATGFLRPDYRILYAIYHYCISPDSHHSEVGPKDATFLYAVGMGHAIDLAQVLFSRVVECLTCRKEGQPSSTGLVLGSLITRVLTEIWNVQSFKSEPTARSSRGTYNFTSWKKSLSQAPVYIRAEKDEDDAFIQMKAQGEKGAKGKVIQGSTRQRSKTYRPSIQPEEKGFKGMLKRILAKLDRLHRSQVKIRHNQHVIGKQVHHIGKYLELPEFQHEFDVEAGPSESKKEKAQEEGKAEEEEVKDNDDDSKSSRSEYGGED